MAIDINEARVENNEVGMWLEWTLATTFGMLLGFVPSLILVNILNLALAQLIVPLAAGAITGIALVWIVRQPEQV